MNQLSSSSRCILKNCARPCMTCRAVMCIYGASTTPRFLFQALHDRSRCEMFFLAGPAWISCGAAKQALMWCRKTGTHMTRSCWQGLDRFPMLLENRHSDDKVLLQDVNQQDRHPKAICCSRNMIRMIIEVPGGALCPCPCQGPCRHQVLQLPEVLVCRHSSHSSLRW